MVRLTLSSTKGNQGLRHFPYTGYLGLTPIRVEGYVRTKLDADAKLLPAKSLTISVRCYESRVGRVNTLQSNVLVDYTQVLWSKPDDVDYEPIGSLDYSFRITVPVKAAGFSTAVFVDYRCLWRIEAVLTHAPIAGVGSRQIKHFELPLIRYDLPIHRPISYSQGLNQITNKPRAPRIRYSLNPPTSPIGPLDLVSIPIHLQPLDNDVSIRNASIIIERRIQLHDIVNSSSPLQPELPSCPLAVVQPPSPLLPSSLPTHSDSATDPSYINSEGLVSSSSLSSSNPTITPYSIFPSSSISVATATSTTPLLPPTPTTPPSSPGPSKIVVNPIAGTESSGHFARDDNGVWAKTLTLQWPAVKSQSRWAIGETIQSELVSVQYFVRTKIIVTSPAGTESIELDERELLVVSTNEAERQLALAKYNERHDQVVDKTLRSKSKSPRRLRPHRDRDDPTPPIQTPPLPSTSAGFQLPKPKSKSSSRRPHTSAGPRDKPFNLGVGAFGRPRGQEPDSSSGHMGSSPHGGSSRSSSIISHHERANDPYCERRVESNVRRPESGPSEVKQTRSAGMLTSAFWSTAAPRLSSTPSGGSASTTASSSSLSSSSVGGDSDLSDHMREWEEELARIEIKSRWSSDLLGFFGKRKRSAASVPKVVVPSDEDYAHS